MPSALLLRPHRAVGVGGALIVCVASAVTPAFAAPPLPPSPLAPELLFGLAILGPMLVPAAAYAAGFIADLLRRNRDD